MVRPSSLRRVTTRGSRLASYFGQFVDHDITLESTSFTTAKLLDPALAPLPLARIGDPATMRT
jgi:hypothetical protein